MSANGLHMHACMHAAGAGVDAAAETAADILPAAAALYVLRMTLVNHLSKCHEHTAPVSVVSPSLNQISMPSVR